MIQIIYFKSSTLTLTLSFVLLFSSHSVNAQSEHSIRFISNPMIYKLGSLENQYTINDNRFVHSNYFNQPSHEFGLEYSLCKKRSGFFAGLSWFQQKHRANYIVYHPDETYDWKILDYHDIQLTENLLGIRIGGQFRINKHVSFGLGLSLYAPLEIKSNMSIYKTQYTRYIYTYYSTPDSNYSELTSKLEHTIQRRIRKGLIIPDLSFNHALSNNFSLTLGFRFKFWSSEEDWLLKYEIKGFTEASESNNEQLVFSSRIQNKGLYAHFGLKYSLPLERKDKSNLIK